MKLANEKLIRLILFVLIPVFSGCVYIPPIGRQFTEEKGSEIVVSKTTKDRVIALLGEPNVLKDRRFFIYAVQRSRGTIWFFLAGGYSGTILPIPIEAQYSTLLLRFDDRNIVDRYEVESAKESLRGEKSLSENFDREPDSLKGELLLEGKGKDLLGFETGIGFNSLAISQDGRTMGSAGFKLVGGLLSSKKIWMKNLDTGELRIVEAPDYYQAVFSPDLARAALLKRKVTIVETATGKTLMTYAGHGDSDFWSLHGASCLVFDRTGRYAASGGYQGGISIWDTQTGQERVRIKGHNKEVLSIAWSHDGRLLATAGLDGFVKMWEASTGEEVFRQKQEAGMLSFSPDDSILAINRTKHIELWRVKFDSGSGNQEPGMELYDSFLLPYTDIASSGISMAWSSDGRFLAAGNGSVIVYDIEKGKKVMRQIPFGDFSHAMGANNAVHILIFSPDDKSIVAGTNEGIYRYPLLIDREK